MMRKVKDPTWGDSVKVSDQAPKRFRPGAYGAVYSVNQVDHPKHAESTGTPIGETTIGVEFSDGVGMEMDAKWLEVVD